MAHSLVAFAAQQNLRLDTFAMGPASRALGELDIVTVLRSKLLQVTCWRYSQLTSCYKLRHISLIYKSKVVLQPIWHYL